ncbi:ribosome maturation factor RimP [Eisenibacter elegans]|jgi:ribosome maturation factor RimP|uniref:ribosome maturation factor RimP n=1 Tax=Eisenibacter elegans TaxID=997 RepID=UPI0004156605|nr:ribosome maturation factor [Eisenibacter elegans]
MNFIPLVQSILEQNLDDTYFVVDLTQSPSPKGIKVKILLDGDHGVDIDYCATISRHIGAALDANPDITEAYVLEVSSPGVDAPLKLKRQYPQHIGRTLQLKLADQSTLEGELRQVSDEALQIVPKAPKKSKKAPDTAPSPEVVSVPFDNIKQATVLISF